MWTTSAHDVVGLGGTVLVVVVDVVLVVDVVVELVLDVDVEVVDDADGEVVDGRGATVSDGDELLELSAMVVVAPGSADWIRSLHAVSNKKPANPANAVARPRRRSVTTRSRPISPPLAASARRGRAPSTRRRGR